jgi:outer membrane putative beta-barrel porin/alpha-amylase
MLETTMVSCARRWAAVLALSSCWAAAAIHGQEIEPRAYSPSPSGVNFLVMVAGRSEGGVLTDPALPVTDIEAKIDALAFGYGRTLGIAGRSANVALALPWISVDASGNVGENRRSASREGLGDAKLRFAMNLIGAPAMTPREFAQREPRTTLGMSFTLNIPSGEYMPDKLVNIGTNRWALKTELGLTYPVGKWLLETYAGAWWFQDNDEFFGGQLREQDPLASIQAHVSYTFKPRLWVALNTTYYEGGQTTVNHRLNADRQSNSRAGITFSMPVGKSYSLKLNWSRGATTRIGSNFTTYGLGLQYAWMDTPGRP